MLVSRKRTSSLPPPILYVSATLQRVTSVRYLGVELTQDLSWSLHISHLCAKAWQLIGLLYRRFYKHANTATLLQLYKSFIRPLLEYCAVVWDRHLSKDIYRGLGESSAICSAHVLEELVSWPCIVNCIHSWWYLPLPWDDLMLGWNIYFLFFFFLYKRFMHIIKCKGHMY